MTRGYASDNVRADAIVNILDAYKQAMYPVGEACDEQAFSDCLIADPNTDLFRWGLPTAYDMFQLFTT